MNRFNGMFALGFYDTVRKRLLLARDHAGIKPLYYLQNDQGLVFTSQYDQILTHPWSRNLSVSSHALGLYLRLGYIPAPYGIMEHTQMLKPGTWLEVDVQENIRQGCYFEFPSYAPPDLFGDEAFEAVDCTIDAAVRQQMVSDVPVGTFLSGGIDSPLVAAKAQAASAGAIKAFTIGTNGDASDESVDAALYAQKIGLEHVIQHVTPNDGLDLLNDVVAACGEPFADYSIFPTMLVSKLARQEVKVMLSGDGGDELFWGYISRLSPILQNAHDFKQPYWLRSARWGMKKLFGIGTGYQNLRQPDIGAWLRVWHTRIPEAWQEKIFPEGPAYPQDFGLYQFDGWELNQTAQWLRWNEFVGHLTMVLMKVDRASMYQSQEVRVPLLDRTVIDVAVRVDWRSCLDLVLNVGKLPLRNALKRHLERPTHIKRGFGVPMNEWLRGSLRPIFEDIVLRRREILGIPIRQAALNEMFQQHLSGQVDHASGLWTLLSLVMWEARYLRIRP